MEGIAQCPLICLPALTSRATGTTLLISSYYDVMNEVFRSLRKHSSICFSLDGATNIQSKQQLNLLLCIPKAFFLHHFAMKLHRKSAYSLLAKSVEAKQQLVLTTAPSAADVEHGQGTQPLSPNTLTEIMFSFTRDSLSVLACLRKKVLQLPEFTVTFASISHGSNNFILHTFKNFDIPKASIENAVYMVQIICSTHLLSSPDDTMCKEKLRIAYVLVIFSNSCCITIMYMYTRLSLIRTVLSLLSSAISTDEMDSDIDTIVKQ